MPQRPSGGIDPSISPVAHGLGRTIGWMAEWIHSSTTMLRALHPLKFVDPIKNFLVEFFVETSVLEIWKAIL